jgi:hypothetical protein
MARNIPPPLLRVPRPNFTKGRRARLELDLLYLPL